MIRVLLADDHNMVRKGLKLLIESTTEITVIGEAASCEEAVQLMHELKPDVVLMDLSFPDGRSGFTAIREVAPYYPDLAIIVLTMHHDPHYIQEAAGMGVKGYLLKSDSCDHLIQAIISVSQGKLYYQTEHSLETIQLWMNQKSNKNSLISDREKEIVRMTALGYTNRQISDMLNISVRTVENHKYNAMKKLKMNNKHELIQYAIHHLLERNESVHSFK